MRNSLVFRPSHRNKIAHIVTPTLAICGEWGIFAMGSVARVWVRGRIARALRGILLGSVLATMGCGTQPTGDYGSDQPAQNDPAQPDLAQQQQAIYAQCISTALNDAVLKSQNVKATFDGMMAQTLDGCPPDFTEGFVKLRMAVRDYAQTLALIELHYKDRDPAFNRDLVNLGCSLFTGRQCAQSSIQQWMDLDDTLKARDADNRAAMQSGHDALETIAARYGVYISAPSTPSAPVSDGATNAM